MCLLALFYRAVDDAPLVVAANREEFYNRPGTPPQVIDCPARAVAGLDKLAGGTWLGVNENSMLVAVTNRHKSMPPTNPRSRGLLAREMLGCRSTKEAMDLATQELSLNRYAGCNIVVADGDRLVVFQAGDWLRIKYLPPGLHVLTNHDINDGSDPRLLRAMEFLTSRSYNIANDCLRAFSKLCASTGNPPICLHGPDRGTVSSSLLIVRRPITDGTYLHANGPPDQTEYQDYSHLLREMASHGNGGAS